MLSNPYVCRVYCIRVFGLLCPTLFGVIFVLLKHIWDILQIINTFSDSVMSVCLTKTEVIAGSVDGTVRTFDIRTGRYVSFESSNYLLGTKLEDLMPCPWFFRMYVYTPSTVAFS